MFKVFITLLLALSTAACMAQVQVPNPPAVKAPNVTIGDYTVWASYPDQADFVLNFVEQRLLISVFEGPEDSDWNTVHYLANVGQVAEGIYRAELDDTFWVEVNTVTGETFWYNNCRTTSYRLPCGSPHVTAYGAR